MNLKILSVAFILFGGAIIFVKANLKPFDSNFEGPLVFLIEFAGPLVFSIGISTLGYQIISFVKKKEWPDSIPQKTLVASIIIGLSASVAVFLYRIL